MTYHTTRRRLWGAASSLALLGSLMASAWTSSQAAPLPTDGRYATDSFASVAPHQHLTSHFWDALELEPQDVWTNLRSDFRWQDQALNARVQEWIEYYQSSPENVAEITERARPWLAWITQQVEARGLPGEIALIPFVESSFDPKARSHFGAAGLWQIMPRTGDALGLKRNGSWDGRVDVVSSTRAALDYIEMQADEWYDGDLLLSLAAYNAGAGTVNNARRAAQSRGLAGEYWDLNLPGETMAYVPKLIAISRIISDPEQYGVALPDISGSAAFARITLDSPISLTEAANLAGVTTRELTELNPGVKSSTVDPRHARQLLVPASSADTLRAQLTAPLSGDTQLASNDSGMHIVEQGDTLSRIAMLHSVSTNDLARWNGIDDPQALRPGQRLTISGS
ncbi:transglycosylase SLT domain-containing protein [Halomonas cupida]|uniref:Membrane-bound lytic murein transglycosylase D n=2 Tax=Halomonas cupida TaxID=44933 RepID=A0A1M7JK76_9GAMM|nr:transglycosylase SLT domain-containing protein [Halomonas cupida]SHM53366.1 membrane-bound lytic murein transglycosylase D [Halomonas cupida]